MSDAGPLRLLGIETTCDETAAAVFTDEPRLLSSAVASQAEMHAEYGGVVPEIASRAHLERILPVVRRALDESQTELHQIAAVAVAYTPGLVGSILVGLTAAKTLAFALGKPLLGVNHLAAHLYACQMQREASIHPCIGLVVSGGHTNLFRCVGADDLELIGATIDDAAGEAFDKVASLLKLGYPGGPLIAAAAETGDPKAYQLPRTFLHEDRLDFSFSGLKTAVRYAVYGQDARTLDKPLTEKVVADAAASFQQAVVDVLVAKCRQAVRKYNLPQLCVGGGVAANASLRGALQAWAQKDGVDLVIPPLAWCTDNAAMAAVAVERFRKGEFDDLDLDAVPGLVRRGKSPG